MVAVVVGEGVGKLAAGRRGMISRSVAGGRYLGAWNLYCFRGLLGGARPLRTRHCPWRCRRESRESGGALALSQEPRRGTRVERKGRECRFGMLTHRDPQLGTLTEIPHG